MAKNTPAFQFYPQDFLGGVALLTDEEVGIYWKLCSALWNNANELPMDFEKLARASLTTLDAFDRCWPAIADKFEIASNRLSHPRFTKDIALREKRRAAGSLGGYAKASSYQTPSKSNGKGLAKACQMSSKVMKDEDRSMKTEERSSKFIPPTTKDVADYAVAKQLTIDPNAFVDFYESKGWKVGSAKMKDWKACARNWSRRNSSNQVRPQDLPRSVRNELASNVMADEFLKSQAGQTQKRIEVSDG